MVWWCWSVKGGVGTSVVAAALSVLAARRGRDTLLVDLGGDQGEILGVAHEGVGLGDWLAADDDVALDALARLEIDVRPGLRLLAWGDGPSRGFDRSRLATAVRLLAVPGRAVVVDAGPLADDPAPMATLADSDRRGVRSILVARACYLNLRRATRVAGGNPAVVLVEEPGRALGATDVRAALGVDRVWRIPWDPAIARAVDAGTFASRVPARMRRLERLL